MVFFVIRAFDFHGGVYLITLFLASVATGFIGLIIALTIYHFVERLGCVNRLPVVREGSLIAIDRCLKGDRKALTGVRTRLITGAQRERVQRMLASTLLKRGTFVVLFLKYVSYRQWMFLPLARATQTTHHGERQDAVKFRFFTNKMRNRLNVSRT